MDKLKSNSPIPLYYQLREIIREKIVSLEWEYGQEIPSELKLCEEFNLCRATVKQALDGLVNDGLIVRKKGKGSFVTYKKLNDNFLLEPSFSSLHSDEVINYCEILSNELEKPSSYLKNIFKLNEEDKIYKIERLHIHNNLPILFDTNYINPCWTDLISDDSVREMVLSKYLESLNNITFTTHKVDIQAITLNDFEREKFNFPENNIGIVVEAISYVDEKPILYSKKIYRGDYCNLSFNFLNNNNKLEIVNSKITVD